MEDDRGIVEDERKDAIIFGRPTLIFSLLFESLVIVFHCVVTLDNS